MHVSFSVNKIGAQQILSNSGLNDFITGLAFGGGFVHVHSTFYFFKNFMSCSCLEKFLVYWWCFLPWNGLLNWFPVPLIWIKCAGLEYRLLHQIDVGLNPGSGLFSRCVTMGKPLIFLSFSFPTYNTRTKISTSKSIMVARSMRWCMQSSLYLVWYIINTTVINPGFSSVLCACCS